MKEARIIFPVTFSVMAREAAIDALVSAFGGATVYSGLGHWKDPNGKYVEEEVRIVDVAYEVSWVNDARLYDIAWDYRHDAGQIEVYLRYGNGNVQMVSERSCMDNGEKEFNFHELLRDLHQAEDMDKETVADIEHAEHVEI